MSEDTQEKPNFRLTVDDKYQIYRTLTGLLYRIPAAAKAECPFDEAKLMTLGNQEIMDDVQSFVGKYGVDIIRSDRMLRRIIAIDGEDYSIQTYSVTSRIPYHHISDEAVRIAESDPVHDQIVQWVRACQEAEQGIKASERILDVMHSYLSSAGQYQRMLPALTALLGHKAQLLLGEYKRKPRLPKEVAEFEGTAELDKLRNQLGLGLVIGDELDNCPFAVHKQ